MIRARALRKVYRTGAGDLEALAGVDLDVAEGEMVAIMGPSGSGKSTLMHILGCLDRPTDGDYVLAGEAVADRTDDDLAAIRNRLVGFVFQQFNLLPRLSALENVELPLLYRRVPPAERRRRAREALEAVGLGDRLHHLPAQLSGGQQQRVAVARALAARPRLLLADEPTGSLDSASGSDVLALFQELNRARQTVVIVTHDRDVALHCQRILHMRDGRLVREEIVTEPKQAGGGRAAASGPEPPARTGERRGQDGS